ncbi:PBP1A family penicillin-binding protein [Palleronia sp. LCG004]|uniref:transglycosylase domain-containing protein n=1 Tax=Palleronia sp. LCG004 TaxID=3079304 RepID=UPI00294230AF|nr:PBP1A family penicillin-binding protein [Palleronia sp. LCG004]WOI56024.1 PBP1A family penicillin-binding protein [Palleronia sp. LCG004]
MASSGKGKRPLVAHRRQTRGTPKETPRKTRTRTPRARRQGPIGWVAGLIRSVMRLFFGLVLRGVVVAALILGMATWYLYSTLPPVGDLLDGRARGSVTMLDRDGEVFAWRGEQFGGQIDAQTISPNLRNAIISTEDRRFYSHFGVSPRGIAGAIRINLSEGRSALSGHGGSTITQQTAKLLCLGVPYDPDEWESEAAYEEDCRRGSLWRKAKEAVFALAMEAKYSKDEILTIYLNRAYLGAGTRGFEAAAQRYFGKSANDVSPAEAAMLAGLLVAPTRYAPTNDIERSQNRANVIVGLMEREGYLTQAEADAARANPAELSAAAEARAGGYFADWVMGDAPDFLTSKTTEDVILSTTFDPRIQRAAESALREIFETKVSPESKAQAAIVVMSADGAVRAMVGGRKFKGVAGQFNRAVMANRQTGSAFKPFVFATALEFGFTPDDVVLDEPVSFEIPGSGEWSPSNYTRDFAGPMTMATALEQSRNVPAVKISEAVGRESVRQVASDFGITSDLADGPALALGVSESTLLEMTGAYAGILNGGTSVQPYGLRELRLQASDEPLIGQAGGLGERVITERAARELTWMMNQVIENGTGQRAKLPGREAAGKTGTTQAARDAWFLGFTADYVTGVWMGYDDNTPLTGVTGGGLPAEIWRETMIRVHEGLPAHPLPMIVPQGRTTDPQIAAPAPQYDGQVTGAQSGEPRKIGPAPQPSVGDVINDVIGRIFGN